MIGQEAYDAGALVMIEGREYIPVHVYDRVVALLQDKLRSHVTTLENIDAELRRLEGQ